MTQKVTRADIAQKLQQDIYQKELSAGSLIGSVRRLAMRYHTTPLTVSRLLNDMVNSGVLYRDEKNCYRLLKNPPVKPHIGYAGYPLLPAGGMDCLMYDAVKKLFSELEKLGEPPQIIGYHELCNSEIAGQRLKNINGLILHDSFWDDRTCKVLNNLTIPIVRVGQTLPKYSDFSSSEVVQFFDPALKEFARYCDLKSYRRIIIVSTMHWNANKLAREIKHFLHNNQLDDRLEMMALPKITWDNAELYAFSHFLNLKDNDWSDTLIISVSGYFSRGISRALADCRERPDILSIDNLDDYEKCTFFDEPFFTAIDRRMGRIFCDAAKLLYEQIKSGDDRNVIIKVPAKLVIRKSIRHINPEWNEK